MTDPEGMITLNEYDNCGNLAAVTVDVGGEALRTAYLYDAVGNRTGVVDPRGSAGVTGGGPCGVPGGGGTNTPPVAANDSATTLDGLPRTISVLANDSDTAIR